MSQSSSGSSSNPCNHVSQVGAGFCVVAQVRWGDNSDVGPDPEYCLGKETWHSGSTNCVSADLQWGLPGPSGTDSGLVGTALNVGSGGSDWTVGSGQLAYAAAPQRIKKVQVLANSAKTGCKIAWSGLVVKFIRSGVVVDTDIPDIQCEPSADGPGQVIIQLDTAEPNIDAVVVTGSVRLQAGAGIIPSGNDLTGEIYVFADVCQ